MEGCNLTYEEWSVALFVDKLKIANILVNGDVPREAAEELAE